MLILAFETSAKAASVALHDGQKLLAENYQNTGMTHSQTLMVMAEDALKQCGKTAADVTAVAEAFTGVPHRLELVREMGSIRYYNSSIDSSPARTEAALSAMAEMNTAEGRRPPIVICGGQDKHLSFDPLAAALCRYASRVILTGEARGQILDALVRCPDYDPEKLPVAVIPDYREAMHTTCTTAADGDTILLSPACTSFDAFKNFEERGEVFRGIVREL